MDYDDALFRKQIPAFKDTTQYPAEEIEIQFDLAQETICIGNSIKPKLARYLLNLLTAHQYLYNAMITDGDKAGLPDGASHLQVATTSIDGVSLSFNPFTSRNQAEYYFGLTPYGLQFYATLYRLSRGGLFFGGFPETLSFRHGGGFPQGRFQ